MSAGSVGEGVVKSGQIEGPPGLTADQRLGRLEIHEVLVVSVAAAKACSWLQAVVQRVLSRVEKAA